MHHTGGYGGVINLLEPCVAAVSRAGQLSEV